MRTVTFDKDFGDQFRMDPKVKETWLAALRSGKFNQGRTALKDRNDNYCCLGVLCELHGQQLDKPVKFVDRDTSILYYPGSHDPNPKMAGVLPPQWVYEWAKLYYKPANLVATLISSSGNSLLTTVVTPAALLPELNDTHRYSFEEIANYIEQYL